MSDKEDVSAADNGDVSVESVYISPENLSFATKNVSPQDMCFTPIKSSVLEETPQRESEEQYCTPSYEKFLQWRSVDHCATPRENSPLVSDDIHDVDTAQSSICEVSLITRMDKLCLFTPKHAHTFASSSTRTETTLVNVESTAETIVDPPLPISHGKHRGETEEKTSLDDCDETMWSSKNEISDTEITFSDYDSSRTETATLPDIDLSSNVTFDDSSIDRPSSWEAQSCASPEYEIPSDFVEAKTKEIRDSAIAESTRLFDDSTTASHDQLLKEDEVYKTDTFDDKYHHNVVQTRHCVQKMTPKKRDRGCFRRFWSPRKMCASSSRSFQEDKRIKEQHQSCRIAKMLSRTEDREGKSPPLKLRLGRTKEIEQVQIPERAKSGNAVSPWRETVDR